MVAFGSSPNSELNRAHDRVHIFGSPHRCDREQHFTLHRDLDLRHLAMHLEQIRRLTKETGARPVAHDVGIGRRRKQRTLAFAGGRFTGGKQPHESVR
jgi:hypothetical protein